MKNDNMKSLSSDLELYNHETWRGAWRGGKLLVARELEWFKWILKNTYIFKAMGGAMMEGRMAGRKNGGAGSGASFGIHGGAPEGRWIDLHSIL